METNNNKDGIEDKKWNGEQNPNIARGENNEGFSSENIPEDYNPAPLKTEIEIDQRGQSQSVERARHEDTTKNHLQNPVENQQQTGNEAIENPKSFENKDRNYDTEDNRYPASDPENHRNRGNMDLDK